MMNRFVKSNLEIAFIHIDCAVMGTVGAASGIVTLNRVLLNIWRYAASQVITRSRCHVHCIVCYNYIDAVAHALVRVF